MEIRTNRLKPPGFSGEALGRAINSAIGTGKYAGWISRLDKVIVLIFDDGTPKEDVDTALAVFEAADLNEKTVAELQDIQDGEKVQAVLNGEIGTPEDLVSAIRYLAKRVL